MFGRKSKIHQLARQTGEWAVAGFDNVDVYWLRSTAGQVYYSVLVKHTPNQRSTRFQTWLPVRFPLDNPPSGVFGRLMLRSWEMSWSAWVLNIGDSCEAKACVTALVSNAGLDAELFRAVCREQTDEVAAFHKELRDKFNYSGQFIGGQPAGPPQTGVPAVWQGGAPRRYH